MCVRKCCKLLISIDSFFFLKNIVLNISRLIYYYNIRLSYRIRNVVENIPINILVHKGKKLWDENGPIKTIQGG